LLKLLKPTLVQLVTLMRDWLVHLGDLGATQTQISNVTKTVALALKVSGASATEASNAMLQLSQAFSAGKLSGDEFRSMAEEHTCIDAMLWLTAWGAYRSA
jgi:hypothetical protein